MGLRIVDLGDLSALCGVSRISEIRRAIESLEPGEEALIVTSDPETWYSLANMGEELGYEVIESSRGDRGYSVKIRLKQGAKHLYPPSR